MDGYQLALGRLAKREQSTSELAKYLRKKGIEETEIAGIIARLVEQRLVDDERYTGMMVRYQLRRGKGSLYIRNKLKEKGVSVDVSKIKSIIDQTGDCSEVEMAKQIIDRRYPDYKNNREVAAKAYQALVRRGFSFEVAKKAVSNKDEN